MNMIEKIGQKLKRIDGTIFIIVLLLLTIVGSFLANMSYAIDKGFTIFVILLFICIGTAIVYYRANRFEGIKKYFWIPYPIASLLTNFLFPRVTHNTEYSGIVFIHFVFICILSFSNAKKK
tara:strand:- start:731 stop:1093 length:363 start_codon:yes stop_codon:yes gene_type:complete